MLVFFLGFVLTTIEHLGLGHHFKWGFLWIYKFLRNCLYLLKVGLSTESWIKSVGRGMLQWGQESPSTLMLPIYIVTYKPIPWDTFPCITDKYYAQLP